MMKLKSLDDIEGIRKSCRLLAHTFEYIAGIIHEGMTGNALDAKAEEFIRDHGGVPAFKGYSGFPATLCISLNEAVIHGIPDKRPFKSGDLVGIDCGISLNGFISDAAHTFPIGIISPELHKLCKIAEESLYLGIAEALQGRRINDISRAIYRHNKREGYGVVRSYCGHGVGFEVHEDPQVPNYVGNGPNPRIKPGMVLAIEPMVNLGVDDVYVADDGWTVLTSDRKPSVHFEHTVAVLADRTEILTLWGSQTERMA